MNEFMQRVANVWYRIYWGWTLLFSLAVIVAYYVTRWIPEFEAYQETFALSSTMFIVAGTHLLYSTIFYWFVKRKSDVPFATLISVLLFVLIPIHGVAETAGWASLIYIAGWAVAVYFVGAFGLSLTLGAVLLTEVAVLMESNFDVRTVTGVYWLLAVINPISAFGAYYFFWKKRYINLQARAVSQLSGMLQSNRQQSEILIQSIADGVIVINTEGKISLMNPAAATMTEWPVQEATGVDAQLVVKLHKENGSDIIPEENPLSLVLRQKQHLNQTLQLDGRDGKKQVISLVISPVVLPDNTVAGAVAVMRDISEQRAAEQQRAEFISTASHEMRTPVAAIEGYLALALNDKVSTIDSRARSYLEKAHASTQHLGKLFQDLLTSSKAEDGRLTNHPGVVEMGTFMQQLTDDLKFAAEKKGLLAEFVIGASDETIDATSNDASIQHLVKPLYYVYVDPDRMREVITNIFDNACKYTESGKISIGLTGNNEVVQLYVRDTGPGIPADDLPHLFQKFYRVDNSATRTIGGTGLGLFICRKIVELYHGRIWAESEVGKGSTFFINLPRLTTQRATELQSTEASKTPTVAVSNSTPGNP